MELKNPDPKPIPVVQYEFKLANGELENVTLWTSLKDTGTFDPVAQEWVFEWPRLHQRQVIPKPYLWMREMRGERVFIDTAEVLKKILEDRERQKREKREKDGTSSEAKPKS